MSGLIIDLSSNELREDEENGEQVLSTEMVLSKINTMLGKESNIDSLLKKIRHNCVHYPFF
jgi:hypothetical protein